MIMRQPKTGTKHSWVALTRRRHWVVAAVALLAAACQQDGPTALQAPEVAGTYAGSFTIRFLVNSEIGVGTMRVMVAQSGEQVTVTGSITILNQTTPIPAITGTLDTDGIARMDAGVVETIYRDLCGNIRTLTSSLTFARGSVWVSEHGDSDYCGRMIFSGTLTRQPT